MRPIIPQAVCVSTVSLPRLVRGPDVYSVSWSGHLKVCGRVKQCKRNHTSTKLSRTIKNWKSGKERTKTKSIVAQTKPISSQFQQSHLEFVTFQSLQNAVVLTETVNGPEQKRCGHRRPLAGTSSVQCQTRDLRRRPLSTQKPPSLKKEPFHKHPPTLKTKCPLEIKPARRLAQ